MSVNHRGEGPTDKTIRELCIRAGWRCEFEGCGKNLSVEKLTNREIKLSIVAHIVASSPNGPRGKSESHALSDKIDNLMLLCQDHHTLIDRFPDIYTVSVLKTMKETHEEKVKRLLDSLKYPETNIVFLQAPIKGYVLNIDRSLAIEAIRLQKRNNGEKPNLIIDIGNGLEYNDEKYWKNLERQLITKYERILEAFYVDNPQAHLSLFPFAPIPIIAKLGWLLSDKKSVDIYQKTRQPDTWSWMTTECTNDFEILIDRITPDERVDRVAIVISLSGDIALGRITEVFDANIIYQIKAERMGVDCIKSQEDLKNFWQKYHIVCDEIANKYKGAEVALFPAVPVSAAFELGRRLMPNVHPKIMIYDQRDKFEKAFTIGGERNVE